MSFVLSEQHRNLLLRDFIAKLEYFLFMSPVSPRRKDVLGKLSRNSPSELIVPMTGNDSREKQRTMKKGNRWCALIASDMLTERRRIRSGQSFPTNIEKVAFAEFKQLTTGKFSVSVASDARPQSC